MDTMATVVLTGMGATAIVDLWSWLRRRLLGVPLPDFGLVGRWMCHLPRGRFRHERIADAPAFAVERVVGWSAHYLIGIAFAALLAFGWGEAWFAAPTAAPALLVGAATVLAPWLLMQPGMGLGLAGRRAPQPWKLRMHSLLTHLVFGAGLYATACLLALASA